MQKNKKRDRICTDAIQGFLFIIEFVQGFFFSFFLNNRICIDTKFEIQKCLKYKSSAKYKGI